MKKIMIALIAICYYSSCRSQGNVRSDSSKVDSVFSYYFYVLDSYLDKSNRDLAAKRVEIISDLERITGIEADGDGTFVGKFQFSSKNLIDWKEWYLSHRRDLGWDPEKKRIK